MSQVYRVLRKKYAGAPFDGEGAYRYGGRWSSPGVRLSYTSEHESLALLEYFVHLDEADAPADLVLATAEIPEDISREVAKITQLPANWRDPTSPPELARMGDDFVSRGQNCLLLVPSVLAPSENSWLINPAHPDFKRIIMGHIDPISYDPRMLEKRRHGRRHTSRI